jgi:purine catabolism regulator
MPHVTSVSELLQDPGLSLVEVHLPDPDVEVRWVATSELVDPAPFLEGGEVLLTTGLDTVGWRTEWHGYVERLVAARVAALGIGVGLTHRRPPAPLVTACRDLGLNLFEVPRETAFVAISRTAARLIEQGEEAAARRALEAQRQLTRAALRQDDTSALLTRLAAVVGGAAATFSRDGHPEVGPVGTRRGELDLAVVDAELRRIRPQGLRAASSVTDGGVTTVVQPVGLIGRPTSYVAVLVPGRASDGQRGAVTTAVALLSLAAESRTSRRDTDRRLRATALELLVQGDARTARIVLAARSGQHLDEVRLPGSLQMIRAHAPADALDDALGVLEEETELAARVDDELWVVASPAQASRLAAFLGERGLLVGVGTPVPADEAARSHAHAGHALEAASAAAPVVPWERLVAEGAMAVLDQARAASFAESFLEPLQGADGDELLETLQSFLRHHGSRLKVAGELGVHRNTVRNRIGQIEAALGRSLDDPQVRVSAWIALQVAAETTG